MADFCFHVVQPLVLILPILCVCEKLDKWIFHVSIHSVTTHVQINQSNSSNLARSETEIESWFRLL